MPHPSMGRSRLGSRGVKKLSDMSRDERPREKLQRKGAAALPDRELLAILLGKGTRDAGVMALADRVLQVLAGTKDQPGIDDLQQIRGVGLAKATSIVAALEFARRRIRPEGWRVTFPTDVLPLIQHYADRKREHFICVSLNGAGEVIQTRVVSVGSTDRTSVHPRDVFADPVSDRAAAVVLAHNHPSGGVEPNRKDLELTTRLVQAGETLGIRVLDHIIFSKRGHYSLCENGVFPSPAGP